MNCKSHNEALFIQYSGTPTQGHEDFIQTLTSPENKLKMSPPPPPPPSTNRPNVHINPRFHGNANILPVTRTSPNTSPHKKSNTVHVNPKFANRPLPCLPNRLDPSIVHAPPQINNTQHVTVSAPIYSNANPNIYENMRIATTSYPIYQNTSYQQPNVVASEPIYSTIGHGLPIDSSKQEQFIKNIQQSIQSQVTTSFQKTIESNTVSSVTSNGVVLRNKYKKDNRPDKPSRNSIAAKSNRMSVVEKPNRYSLIVEKPKRNSVYSVDNRKSVNIVEHRKPVKPVRQTIIHSSVPVNCSTLPVSNSGSDSVTSSTSGSSLSCSTPALGGSNSSCVPMTPTPTMTSKKTDEKENLPSTTKKSFLFTPLRKTPFKKIGTRKLIRVKKKSLSPGTPKPSFKRIGNTKLIRIRDSLTSDKSTPTSIYSIRTKTKIVKKVKNTPSNISKFRFSFITPLSVRKNRIVRQTSNKNIARVKKRSFTSRFKLDRRDKKDTFIHKGSGQSRLKKLSNGTYHVSATKLQKVGSTTTPVKPARTRNISIYRPKANVLNPNIAPNKVISVQGIKFTVADNGRKLKRLSESDLGSSSVPSTLAYSASVSQTSPGNSQTSPAMSSTSTAKQTSPGLYSGSPIKRLSSPNKIKLSPNKAIVKPVKKTYIGGEEFDEIEPGVFTRSRHSLTRQSITQAKARSINTILKVQNRSKQYCMFFNKFGKCTKKEKGTCPYIHDSSKIAVCRRFLQGACTKDVCLLSHDLQLEKMPQCKFFLDGVCTKQNCPYLHVKVSDEAGVCERFLKGFCPNGADCSQRHVIACPQFDLTGSCSKPAGKCALPHIPRKSAESQQDKKVAPSKPKRKSLGPTEQNQKKSRVTATSGRYYDDQEQDTPKDNSTPSTNSGEDNGGVSADIEERRRRILDKIEQAKQAWRSSMLGDDASLDTGISEGQDVQYVDTSDSADLHKNEKPEKRAPALPAARPPLGKLEDFISLEGFHEDGNKDEQHVNDRLI